MICGSFTLHAPLLSTLVDAAGTIPAKHLRIDAHDAAHKWREAGVGMVVAGRSDAARTGA
jgi:hypothetical protein